MQKEKREIYVSSDYVSFSLHLQRSSVSPLSDVNTDTAAAPVTRVDRSKLQVFDSLYYIIVYMVPSFINLS